MSKSQMKSVLITFFDIRGIVHFEFISQEKRQSGFLCGNGYLNLCIEKDLNFGLMIGFSMTILQLTRCSLSNSV